jgi:ribosome-binding protein aMBF1 (putative translation factor)
MITFTCVDTMCRNPRTWKSWFSRHNRTEEGGIMRRLDRIELGRFIRKVRKSKKLRQEDLVDEVLSQAVISNIESGKTQVSGQLLTAYASA